MHERSLVRALLRQVEDVAAQHPGSNIQSIRVRIGELSGVESALLASAYDELVQDTPLRGASLDLEHVRLKAVCQTCGHEFPIEHFHFQCDRCGSVDLTVLGGEELLLDSVMFEETEP
jgi:hydrogenase nickel incorporation protein HypA/HybF